MEPDYEASGFVVPAGYSAPSSMPGSIPGSALGSIPGSGSSSGVVHANAPYGQPPMYKATQAGHFHSAPPANCDTGFCGGGCDGMLCGGGQCGGGCVPLSGGLLGGHGHGPGLSKLRHICMFCRGDGCGVCQGVGAGHLLGCLASLGPYTEGGIGAQRWYDISAEALFLAMDNSLGNFAITSNGQGPTTIALRAGDAYNTDFDAGVRLSASLICGVGGNIEVTYMGVNDWGGGAAVGDRNAASPGPFFSFISDFGTAPNLGYDDTDRSVFQGISTTSSFHSGEVNYRRRWVGPYSRFQGSWLAGVRHVDFDDTFNYSTFGEATRFLNSRYKASNSMTGFQLGADLWWNIYPGINFGMGAKGAILGNDARMDAMIEANSLGAGGFGGRMSDSETSWLTEFDATLVYRFNYSWSFRSSYYLINIDEVALGASGLQNATFTGVGLALQAPVLGNLATNDDLTIQGFAFGLEYLW